MSYEFFRNKNETIAKPLTMSRPWQNYKRSQNYLQKQNRNLQNFLGDVDDSLTPRKYFRK